MTSCSAVDNTFRWDFWVLVEFARERKILMVNTFIPIGIRFLSNNFLLQSFQTKTQWSTVAPDLGSIHFMNLAFLTIFPPYGLSFVASLMCPGFRVLQLQPSWLRFVPQDQHQNLYCRLILSKAELNRPRNVRLSGCPPCGLL